MSTVYDPWAEVARRGSIELKWLSRPDKHFGLPAGLTNFPKLRISLRVGINSAELRSTLAHELVHLERGPVSKGVDQEEDLVEYIAAKRLVDPAAFDLLLNAEPSPTAARVKSELQVDWRVFRYYRGWRRGISKRTATRVWRQSQEAPAWPPAWFARYPEVHELAARRELPASEACL